MADLNPLSLSNAALAGLTGMGDSKGRTDNNDASDDILRAGANFTDLVRHQLPLHKFAAPAPEGDKDHAEAVSGSDKDHADKTASFTAQARAAAVRADDRREAVADRRADDAAAAADAATVTTAAKPATDPLVNTPSVKGMQKIAATLLQAEKDGKVSLPPAIKTLLEKIAASDGSTAQIVPLMKDMLGALRKLDMSTSDAALKQPAGDMIWPADITDMFAGLQVNPGVKTGQTVDLGKIIKSLRALANLVQQAAADLAEAKAATASAQDAVIAASMATPSSDTKPVTVKAEHDAAHAKIAASQDTQTMSDKAAQDTAIAAVAVTLAPVKPVAVKAALPEVKPLPALSDAVKAPAGVMPAKLTDANDVLDKTPRFDKAAPSAAASASKTTNAAETLATPVFHAPETPTPVLDPMAAALSARTILTAGAATPGGTTVSNIPHPSTQQIIVALQKSPISKDTSLSLQLHPAELGRVDVKITIDASGKASAQVTADRAETLALLQKDTSHLEKALQAAGLNSSAQDLHYSLREQNGKQNGQESGKRRRALFDAEDDVKNITLDSTAANDGLPHRVNYHA